MMADLIRFKIAVHAPVALLAMIGSGLSSATIWNVGLGQKVPDCPRMLQVCQQFSPSSTCCIDTHLNSYLEMIPACQASNRGIQPLVDSVPYEELAIYWINLCPKSHVHQDWSTGKGQMDTHRASELCAGDEVRWKDVAIVEPSWFWVEASYLQELHGFGAAFLYPPCIEKAYYWSQMGFLTLSMPNSYVEAFLGRHQEPQQERLISKT